MLGRCGNLLCLLAAAAVKKQLQRAGKSGVSCNRCLVYQCFRNQANVRSALQIQMAAEAAANNKLSNFGFLCFGGFQYGLDAGCNGSLSQLHCPHILGKKPDTLCQR